MNAPIDRLALLEEENAWLRRELGLSIDATRCSIVAFRHGLSLQQARLLLALHAAGGRTLTKPQLLTATAVDAGREDDRELKIIDVIVHKVRAAIGAGMISTSWGVGYALTPAGIELLRDLA